MSQGSWKRENRESVFKQNEVEKVIALNVMKRSGEIERMTVRK
jgi:hypothetical protein